jgi:hypothetical protein
VRIKRGVFTDQAKSNVIKASLIILVVISLTLCVITTYFAPAILFFILPETEYPIDQIAREDTEIVLTCIATHSGPIILTLKSCPENNATECKEIDTIYESGTPCQEYELDMNMSNVIITTHSGSLVKTYSFAELK